MLQMFPGILGSTYYEPFHKKKKKFFSKILGTTPNILKRIQTSCLNVFDPGFNEEISRVTKLG